MSSIGATGGGGGVEPALLPVLAANPCKIKKSGRTGVQTVRSDSHAGLPTRTKCRCNASCWLSKPLGPECEMAGASTKRLVHWLARLVFANNRSVAAQLKRAAARHVVISRPWISCVGRDAVQQGGEESLALLMARQCSACAMPCAMPESKVNVRQTLLSLP